MKKVCIGYFFFVVFLGFPLLGIAQSLLLLDAETGFPVPHALVFNQSKTASVLSGETGRVPLQKFSDSGLVYIQHPSYSLIEIDLKSIFTDTVIRMKTQGIELGEVVISASQKLESYQEIPREVVPISKQEINFYKPQTSADMLDNSGQVFVQKSQQGGGSPMIRGLSANSVLLVYDNIRLNNAISRDGNLHSIISVDQNFLESTEVILGPGTVVYGSDALGGVVHMRSEEITLGGEEMKFRGDLALTYSTANKGKVGHVDFGSANKKWGWHTSLSLSSFDDLKMGSKGPDEYLRSSYVERKDGKDVELQNEDPLIQVQSGFDLFSVAQKFRFALSKHSDIQVFGQFSGGSDIPRYDRLIQKDKDKLKYAEWYYGPQEWGLAGVRWTSNKVHTWTDLSTVSMHYQTWDESRHDRKIGSNSLNERYEYLDIYGMDIDFSKSLGHKQAVNYGFSTYFNEVTSRAHITDIDNGNKEYLSTRYPDGGSEMSISGAYLNYKNQVKTKWNLNVGMRYTYQYLRSSFNQQSFVSDKITMNTGALSGSAGTTFRPVSRVMLRGNVTSGFRAPNVDDVSKLFDPEPGTVIVPNVHLKPEYLYSAEFGVEVSDSSHYWLDVNAFYSYLDGAIIRDEYTFNGSDSIVYDGEMKQVQALVNKDYAVIYGFGFGLKYSPVKRIQIKINYTITRGYDSEYQPLRHVSPDFGTLHGIYTKGKFRSDVYLKYHNGITANHLAPSEVSKDYLYAVDENGDPYSPSWATLNVMVQYSVSKNLDLNVGVENLLDVRYRTYSSGIAAPGRNFVFGIKSKL